MFSKKESQIISEITIKLKHFLGKRKPIEFVLQLEDKKEVII